MRLIINGFDVELTESQKISRTLQVNDILTLSNRQSNYTNTFAVKRTDVNKQIFEYLGVVGSTTILPYRKNECYLYTDDGECLVYKGWAVIQSTDKEYKINIYDGNIDLYKAIENKSLGDLDLSEIDHSKNLATVVNSFTANLNYKYIVADYNGLMVYNNNRINIDYLVPSAKVSYLWDKIFDTYGFTYEGSVFNTVNFTNLWLSYPKFAETAQTPVVIFYGESLEEPLGEILDPFKFDSNISIDNVQDINKTEFIITTTGTYRFSIGWNVTLTYEFRNNLFQIYQTQTVDPSVFINGVNYEGGVGLTNISLIAGDVITVGFADPPNIGQASTTFTVNADPNFFVSLEIAEFQGGEVSFSNELKDFSIKDFITEILNRFGLTPFKDKYSNHYKFLTLQELLQNNDVVDWSREQNKFVEKISERYIFGSYAQENNFTYKYNDTESDYYNSEILIDNVNLPDNKVVVNSKVYAPEKERTILVHDLVTNVYRMWNKEIKEDGTINYKGLSKRYYLMREDSHTFTTPTDIGSESLNTHQSIETIPVESFVNLRMEDVVREYYANISQVLNYSKIIDATIYLSEMDIANLDFSKLYWIKELSNYFLLNKVSNFTKKGITKVELIKVDYVPSNTFPTPFIVFEQGSRERTANINEPITIYQNTLYNSDIFEVTEIPTGSTLVSLTLNEIVISFASTGTYPSTITVGNKDTGQQIKSNELNIIVI